MAARTDPPAPELSPELRDALRRQDLAFFTREAFSALKPQEDLIWGEYLDLICSTLQEVADGATSRLIITVPPRFLKSICGSVALPAFFLGHNPSAEVMCVSYSQEIAQGFGEATRTLMTSPLYKSTFATRLKSERAPPHLLRTTGGGVRRATSITGSATALGANLLIFDDPQKAGETLSEAVRRATNQAYENTFLSRQNDPKSQRIVIIMQRLHEDDFVGHVLSLGGDWKLIDLPAIAEDDEVRTYNTIMGEVTWKRAKGASLHPERWPIEVLLERRAISGEAVWASQYQQNPTPAGGGLVKSAWFRRIGLADWPEEFDQIVQSWDTANTIEQWSDFSVCTTWGLKGGRIYLLNVFRQRLLYPDLKRAALHQASLFGAHKVLIENKASGLQLLQELPVLSPAQSFIEMKPEGDKQMRMSSQTGLIENGFVFLPDAAPWVDEYLHEMIMFPNGRYDDQVDSTSQFLFWKNNVRFPGQNAYEFTQQEAERAQARRTSPAEDVYVMAPPPGDGVPQLFGADGRRIMPDADGLFRMTRAVAAPLLRQFPPWRRVR